MKKEEFSQLRSNRSLQRNASLYCDRNHRYWGLLPILSIVRPDRLCSPKQPHEEQFFSFPMSEYLRPSRTSGTGWQNERHCYSLRNEGESILRNSGVS